MGHTSPDYAVDIDQSERERERERGREGGSEVMDKWVGEWNRRVCHREQNKQTDSEERELYANSRMLVVFTQQ